MPGGVGGERSDKLTAPIPIPNAMPERRTSGGPEGASRAHYTAGPSAGASEGRTRRGTMGESG